MRVRRDPNDHVSRTALAARYLEVGDIESALRELREATRIAPQFPDAQYNLAAALLARGEKSGAITAYRRAIELDPNYAEAHNNLGVLLESVGDRVNAIAHYELALKIQPHQAGAHYNLANVRLSGGELTDAIAHYRQALISEPAHADAHGKLGLALSQLGRRAEAIAEYKQALALNPRLGTALVDYAWLLATAAESNVRNAALAVALTRRAMQVVGADHPAALDALAAAYASEGRFDEAVETARRAAARAKAMPEFETRVAQIEQRVQLYLAHRPFRMPD
jgi:tetratricopeptide (TPR) repeat protein